MIKKFLNPSGKLTYEEALRQAGERVKNLMKPSILAKGINNSDSRFKFKEKGIKRLFEKEAERERRMTQGSPTSEIVRIRTKKADPVKKMMGLEEDEFRTEPRVIGMSGADPLMEFYVGGEALGPLFKLLGKGALYTLGRYYRGTNYGDWAAAKLIAPEMNRALANNSLKLIPSIAQHISLTNQPIKLNETGLTSLKFFERKPSNISLTEKMGIPKGDRGNLTLFLKDALEDLNLYINSGLYRQLPTINMETAEPSWVSSNGNISALKLLIDDGVPSSGRLSWAWNRPNGGTYELVTDGNGNFGIGYNSYRMFDISPEFNVRIGEASAGSARHGYSKIFLTAPKNDAMHFITETPEQELAKKTLIETQSPRISKDIMRDFWSGVLLSLRPGAYLSGDEGMLPKGATLIRQFKELLSKGYRRDNSGNIIGSGRTNWEDIRNSLMRPEKWKRREDGLSTDSYLALLKQASRENSPYYLRYSPDGFTTFNSQSIDNKFISDLLEKTKTGEATQQEFLDAFHNWVSPYGGMDAKIVNGEIVIPHPFLYKKKQGGKMIYKFKKGNKIHIKKANRGKFTDYCGGKVTNECILRGKNSSDPAVRKRATFAANARKWNHKKGGIIVAGNGIKLGNIFSKVQGFLNSDTGKLVKDLAGKLYSGIKESNNQRKQEEQLLKDYNYISKQINTLDVINKTNQLFQELQLQDPNIHVSEIDWRNLYGKNEGIAKQLAQANDRNYLVNARQLMMLLNSQSSGGGLDFSGLINAGALLLAGNKNKTNTGTTNTGTTNTQIPSTATPTYFSSSFDWSKPTFTSAIKFNT